MSERVYWFEEPEMVNRLTSLVRKIDPLFEADGGGTRHWVRDWFLPELADQNLRIVDEAKCLLCGHAWRRHDPADGMCDAHSDEADVLGPCRCGRDLAFMQERIAALSHHALTESADRRIEA